MATTPEQMNQAIITALQSQLSTIVTETTKAIKRSLQGLPCSIQSTIEKNVKRDEIPNLRESTTRISLSAQKRLRRFLTTLRQT